MPRIKLASQNSGSSLPDAMHIKGRLLFLYKVGVLGAEPLGEGVVENKKRDGDHRVFYLERGAGAPPIIKS